ncbi:hypothetical protein PV677_35970 [Streptomyces sp. DE06-01C]|uniref:hypothetical protein n=1 Tax=Streptomyces sp. DE06-01C TaxID=3028656 RepID=UPI0029C2D170|nr:hypothetical protein [Streptomyces sp. DE06-01C]MDX5526068.1 hypothetical protein [Streptomyces sp. DE06-01C]
MTQGRLVEAETAGRRAKLLKLRRQGIPYDDPRIMGLGYANAGAARKDLTRALQHHHDEEAAEASVYRQQENERLDALLAAVWDKATTPSPVFNKDREIVAEEIDLKAVDTVLKLMDRRAKLNGLDMPQRTELSGPDGGAVPFGTGSLDELNALIGFAGQSTPTKATSEPKDTGGDADG